MRRRHHVNDGYTSRFFAAFDDGEVQFEGIFASETAVKTSVAILRQN
jgi:hypothetical protein